MTDTASEPDAQRVLGGIDAEIKRINDQRTPAGWTNWAVLAGIAGLTWTILGLLKDVHFTRQTAQAILIAALTLDMLRVAWIFLSWQVTLNPLNLRSREMRVSHRPQIAVNGLRYLATSVGLYWLGHRGWATAFYGGGFLAQLFLFGLTFWKLSAPPPADKRREEPVISQRVDFIIKAVSYLLVIAMYVAFFRLIQQMWGTSAQEFYSGRLTDVDLKFAAAVVGLSFLASRLALDLPHPVASALAEVRRDLAFGRIDALTAVNRTDAALGLAKLRDVFAIQKYISDTVTMIDEMKDKIDVVELADVESSGARYRQADLSTRQSMTEALIATRDLMKRQLQDAASKEHALRKMMDDSGFNETTDGNLLKAVQAAGERLKTHVLVASVGIQLRLSDFEKIDSEKPPAQRPSTSVDLMDGPERFE